MPLAPPLIRWADGLSVGLLVQTLSSKQREGEGGRREELRRSLTRLFAAVEPERHARALPFSSLRALGHERLKFNFEGGPKLVDHARSVAKQITTSANDGTPAMTAAARFVAHLCLEGTCSATFIVRCAKSLLSKNWHWTLREKDWRDMADQHLSLFRAQSTVVPIGTLTRIEHLADFAAVLPGSRPAWALIENAIFHQLFAWPLLVDSTEPPGYDCLGLPVAVDIHFDGRSEVYIGVDELGPNAPLRIEWHSELSEALRVAKFLWRSKHGGIPTDFRERLLTASVSFDFAVAERVASWAPFQLRLFDSSMVPYFAQVILHRMLGRSLGFSCAVIGKLGERRLGKGMQPSLDFKLKSAGNADRKLAYVFNGEEYASAVLSTEDPESVRVNALQSAQMDGIFANVNICHYLSNIADVAQPKGWRQTHYVRCPDVLRLMHLASDELLPSDNLEVVEIGKLLASNDKSILHLPERTGVLALSSYLHHVNGVEREALWPATPPSLSWAVIRATESENDRKFWHTIWDTIGARWDDFARFRQATNATAAAQHIKDALNTFSPTEACLSHRAPDLLIIINSGALDPSDWKDDAAEYRSHLFGSLIKALGDCQLLPAPIEAMRRFIGQTRIIVMRSGGAEVTGYKTRPAEPVDQVSRGALERLSTFRYGFTQQMARVLLGELGHKGSAVRRLLEALVKARRLNYASGEYWVSGGIGRDTTSGWTPEVRAQRHWAAAKAFAPYLAVTQHQLQVDLNAAFAPAAVHEALFHIEKARRAETIRVNHLSFNHPERKLLQLISTFKGRLLRFVQLASPGTVQDLTKKHSGLSSVAAWELALEQLEEKARLGIAPTPQERVIYAQAGAAWLNDVKDDRSVEETRRLEVLRETLNLYDLALEETEQTPDVPTRRLSVLTHYGLFLWQFGDREQSNRNSLTSVRLEVQNLALAGVRSATVAAKFFELEGDCCEQIDDAARQYRYITMMSPTYRAGWVKLAGTDASPATLAQIERTLRRNQLLDETVAWARSQLSIRTRIDSSLIMSRWISGIAALTRLTSNDLLNRA